MGDQLTLNFAPETQDLQDFKNMKLQGEILATFQKVDGLTDKCEKALGQWNPENKFTNLYAHLDELCDRVEDLDTRTLDSIGTRAKELNKELGDIVQRLQQMSDVNYDKNKVDFLFMMLEKSLESEDHVKVITERLRAIEKIHKESPNVEGSIKSLVERQKLIDLTFKHEDAEINKTKKSFLETMQAIQIKLKEITILQKESISSAPR